MQTSLTLVLALLLALIHLVVGRLRFLSGTPRSIWLSLAGGISVAYVFIHLLPELSEGQETFEAHGVLAWFGFLEHHVYLLALVGLVGFYGLERAARSSRRKNAGDHGTAGPGVFRLHLASFGLYNGIIGYLLLHREMPGLRSLLLYFFAMAVHFVVNDFGLRDHFGQRYDRYGRWILAAMPLLGWGVGWLTKVGDPVIVALFAVLSGGVVLNVLKEELPEERASRFWAFSLGVFLYSLVLLGTA